MRTVAICIPTYNDWDRLDILLKSIENELVSNLVYKWTIAVIDNSSNTSKPSTLKYEFVNWLSCTKPGSYAARNKALSKIESDFFFFTDSDCQIGQGTLRSIEETISSKSSIELVAGRVEIFPVNSQSPTIFEALDMIVGLNQKENVKKGSAVTANLLIAREVFDVVGLFDETKFSGGDAEFV